MADSGRILPVALGWKTGSPLRDPDMRLRRRLRIDGDSDDGSTSNDSSSSGDTASTPSSIRPCTASSVGARPIISMSVSAANAMNETSKTKRRTSIDSLLSDSSSSIEGYLKTLKISEDRVAAQVPATFNMPDSSDDEEDVEDPISAWVRESHSKDYILSSKKRPLSKWPDLRLPRTLYRQLFDFQRHGVQWMAGLHTEGIGGILGDDMGVSRRYATCLLT
jgi:SNF2 family DNA or RNA helicase